MGEIQNINETINMEPIIPQEKKHSTLKIIIIITTIIILIAIIVYFTIPETTEEAPLNISKESTTQSKIEKCAIPNPNTECSRLYSTPDIKDKCQELENNKDQCLYNFAIINNRFDVCEIITNLELNNQCNSAEDSSLDQWE